MTIVRQRRPQLSDPRVSRQTRGLCQRATVINYTGQRYRRQVAAGDSDWRRGRAMKVCIVASGSRGDVQPTVALAAALAARGHETRLVAPKNFGALAEGRGFAFHPMPIDVVAMASDPVHDILISGRGGPLAFIRWSREWWRAMVDPIACAILE